MIVVNPENDADKDKEMVQALLGASSLNPTMSPILFLSHHICVKHLSALDTSNDVCKAV